MERHRLTKIRRRIIVTGLLTALTTWLNVAWNEANSCIGRSEMKPIVSVSNIGVPDGKRQKCADESSVANKRSSTNIDSSCVSLNKRHS